MHAAAERVEPCPPRDFEALVRAHTPTLRRFCTRLAGASDGDDLMQETLTRAMVSFDTLRDRDRFLPWCRQIARNTHARRAQSIRQTEPLQELAASADVASEVVDALVLRHELAEMLGAMSERSRHVLTARAEGVSPADLASEFGVSRTLVDTWFARSRAQARVLLRTMREGGPVSAVGLPIIDKVRRATRRRVARRSLIAGLVAGAGVTTLLLTAPRPAHHPPTTMHRAPVAAVQVGAVPATRAVRTRPTAGAGIPPVLARQAGHPLAAPRVRGVGRPLFDSWPAVARRAQTQPIVIGPLLPDDQLLIGVNPCAFGAVIHAPCPPVLADLRIQIP